MWSSYITPIGGMNHSMNYVSFQVLKFVHSMFPSQCAILQLPQVYRLVNYQTRPQYYIQTCSPLAHCLVGEHCSFPSLCTFIWICACAQTEWCHNTIPVLDSAKAIFQIFRPNLTELQRDRDSTYYYLRWPLILIASGEQVRTLGQYVWLGLLKNNARFDIRLLVV